MHWIWWAPLGAAILHIVEEFVYPGGFASWDREYRPSIRDSITPRLHLIMNTLLLVACLLVPVAGMPGGAIMVGGLRFRSAIPPSLAVAGWLTLAALLFSNALFHLLGTYRTGRVSPGVRTGLLLYVPMALFGYFHFLRTGQASVATATGAAILGGSYHAWAELGHRWRAGAAGGTRGRPAT